MADLLRLPGVERHHAQGDRASIPHIEALLDATRGAAYFTKFDLASAYNQFGVRKEGRWKTSFRCPLGQYEWNVMPYGVQGASSVLQRYMHRIFRAGLGAAPAGLGGASSPGPVALATGPWAAASWSTSTTSSSPR